MILLRLILAFVLLLACDNATFATNESIKQVVPIKVGFVLCGYVTDYGWNKAHNEGRLYLEESMKGKVQTICAENVSENADADLSKQVPKAWFTGLSWNFGPLYKRILLEVINGNWKPGTEYYKAKDGYVTLTSCGNMVSDKTKSQANLTFQKIKDGKLDIFTGPIKDNRGNLKISPGKTADNHCIEHMNWVVPGVEGYTGK
jgi:basic membrane lipoprotein Med (substrate-binding protein (PBP1-ABC) superfamily)